MTSSTPRHATSLVRARIGIAAVALLAIGGGAGAIAGHAFGPAIELAPVRAIAIRALPAQNGIVTIRARVAEVYGNKFVADDGTGRTLVDLGRAGDKGALVADGQTVSVQGRFDRSVLHASFLIDAADKVLPLGPAGGPPHGHPGQPRDDRGAPPHDDRGAPPPPAA